MYTKLQIQGIIDIKNIEESDTFEVSFIVGNPVSGQGREGESDLLAKNIHLIKCFLIINKNK